MRFRHLFVWLLGLSLAACQGAGRAAPTIPVPTVMGPTPTVVSSSAASRLVTFSGEAAAESDPFSLAAPQTVRVTWDYQGRGHFAIWLVNVSVELDDPAYARLLVTDASGATASQADVPLIAGDYLVAVEEADGPWTIQVSTQP